MVVPAIEVVFTNIGTATIDDETTEDGQKWLKAFVSGVEGIPGVNFAAWGRSYKYPDIAMHFIGTANPPLKRLGALVNAQIGGAVPDTLKHIMNVEKTDCYIIHPHTSDRHVFYAPQTNVVLFYGIDEDKFAELSPEFFTAIAKSDSCVGYIWGEIQPPATADKSGNLQLGKCGIMISGWRSREEHDRDVAKPRVTEAYTAVSAAVARTDTWGMQVTLVENNGHLHKWRRLAMIDASRKLVAPGKHRHVN